MYYLADFSEITDKDRARSKKYSRIGAGVGAATLIPDLPRWLKASKGLPLNRKLQGLLIGTGLNAGAGYLAGKAIARLRRGSHLKNKNK